MDDARRQQILSQYVVYSQVFDEVARRRRGPAARFDVAPADRSTSLSRRTAEVLELLADGCGNKEIAARLHVSTETAKTHVRNVLVALEARNRAHAVAIGFRRGLLGGDEADDGSPAVA